MSLTKEDVDRLVRAEHIGKLRQKACRDQNLSLDTEFTCDACPLALTCESAFDAYNTFGDCLEEK